MRLAQQSGSQSRCQSAWCCGAALWCRLRLALLGTLLVGLGALAQTFEPPPMQPQKLANGAWYVQGLAALGSSENQNFISNASFVITPAGVVVIDALGSPALAERLLAQIAKLTPLPVTHVIVTHYHADHIYGLQTFAAQGARIMAHGAAREYLNSDNAQMRLQTSRENMAPWVNAQTRLVAAHEWLGGERTLVVGGVQFLIRAMGPSHTPEDLVVYVPEKKLLFAGDLVFRQRVPFVGQADSGGWIKALDTLLGYGATTIVPGHGPASTEARADLQMTRDYLQHLRASMGPAARDMTPFEQAYQGTDWSRFETMPMFQAANRINAYNTYLLMEREAP